MVTCASLTNQVKITSTPKRFSCPSNPQKNLGQHYAAPLDRRAFVNT